MKQFHCLALLAAGVASSPIEILNYEAAEAGHGQVMSGTPGEAVVGEFYWKAPEGDDIKLVYTADMAGYVATGAHLPLSPELTPEVMEARAAFMDKFAEAEAQAEEDMAVVADVLSLREGDAMAEVDDMAVVAEARKRRDVDADAQVQLTQPLDGDAQVQLTQPLGADAKVQLTQPLGANAQVQLTQPLHYAHNYPYYFVNNLLPTVKKVDEDGDMEMHMADETGKKVDEATAPQHYYLPMYAPSYYYPSVVQYPATTVTRTVGPWYPVQYPLSYPGLVPQLQQPLNTPSVEDTRILPSETQAGEDESAALLL